MASPPSDRQLALWPVFEAVAAAVPDRTAIVVGGRRVTYGELASRSRRLARFLIGLGVGLHRSRSELQPWEIGQDVVAVYLLNGPEYLEVTFAAHAARAVPANVNYRYVDEELAYLLDDSKAAVVVYHARFGPVLERAVASATVAPVLVCVDDGTGTPPVAGALDYEDAIAGTPDDEVEPHGGPWDPDDLYLLYTGGTTGMPKGTLWRQADVYEAALGGQERPGQDAAAIGAATTDLPVRSTLPIAPFMHGGANWVALRALLRGETVVINDVVDRLDPADVWSLVGRERVHNLMMIGEAYARPLLDEVERGAYDVSSLRMVLLGGAATSPETKARILAALPDVVVADVAGASETGSLLSAVSAKGREAEPGVFQPGPTTVVLDAERQRVLAPGDDEAGWLAKTGRIPLGYLGDRAKTEATFPTVGGTRYVVPGDRAQHRADGAIVLLGRDSVTINSGGEKIFAEEVEAALLRVPDVRDAVVVGRPSERWGQEVVAVVAIRDGITVTDEELVGRISGIARYKLPKAVVRVDAVVRSPTGKADYAWARRVAEAVGS